MTLLHMDTDSVRDVASQLVHVSDSIQANAQAAYNQAASVDWMGPNHDQFISEFSSISRNVEELCQQVIELRLRLEQEIIEWEEMGANLSDAGALFTSSPATEAYIYSLIAAGGGITSGFDISILTTYIRDWLARMLRRGLTNTNPVIFPGSEEPSVPTTPPAEDTPSGFGALLESPPPERVLSPAESLAQNALDVPVYGQGDLGGKAACAPTSMSMLMAYWNGKDSTNSIATPQEMYQAAKTEGYFVEGKGMDFGEVEALFEKYGYEADRTTLAGADGDLQNSLQTQLQGGPLMALVRLNLTTSKEPHAVLITGISDDGSMIRINDPWQEGKVMDIEWNKFKASWESFDGEIHDHMVVTARPQGMTP